jgi:acetyl-CoA carboxylase biotin carboxyl carrier protein
MSSSGASVDLRDVDILGELAAHAADCGLAEITLSAAGVSVTMMLTRATSPAAAAPVGRKPASAGIVVAAASPGLFRSLADRADPEPGPAVREGDLVACLECGPLLLPVIASRSGRLGPALQREGALVGFGTPLYEFTSVDRAGP